MDFLGLWLQPKNIESKKLGIQDIVLFDGTYLKNRDNPANYFSVNSDGAVIDYNKQLTAYTVKLCKRNRDSSEWQILRDGKPSGWRYIVRDGCAILIIEYDDVKLTRSIKIKAGILSALITIVMFAVAIGVPIYLSEVSNCNNAPLFSSCTSSNYDGTYYKYEGAQLNKTTYFTLKNGEWEDNYGFTGKYIIEDGKISLYLGEILMLNGTIGNGKMKLETSPYITSVYYKEGSEP